MDSLNSLNFLKTDFVNKLKSEPQEVKFISDQLKINSFEAFDYYYNSVSINVNKDNLCAFICNSSVESIIISFFLILDNTKIIFLSSDQSIKDIKNVFLENSINEVIIFDNELMNSLIKNFENKKIVKIQTLNNFIFSKRSNELFFSKFLEYANTKAEVSIFLSSGSTAKPKLIPLEYKNINFSYKCIKDEFMTDLDFSRIICIHDTSFVIIINFLQAFCAKRKSKVYGIDFNNTHLALFILAKSIKEDSKDIIITIPSVYLSALKLIENFGITNLEKKSLISCGEPLTSKLALSYFNKKPNNFLNLYGSTELASWVLSLDVLNYLEKRAVPSSILPAGRPLRGMNLELGQNNELLVNSDCVFNGYLNNSNNDTYKEIDSQIFFRTGDQFSVFDDLYNCQGRLNNALKIGGRFINPIILESQLKSSYDFQNVLIISDNRNLVLRVFLFISKIQKELFTKETIKTKMYQNISNKINLKIQFVYEKPKSLRSGKIDRKYYANLDL